MARHEQKHYLRSDTKDDKNKRHMSTSITYSRVVDDGNSSVSNNARNAAFFIAGRAHTVAQSVGSNSDKARNKGIQIIKRE
jgi:hypothetical protein